MDSATSQVGDEFDLSEIIGSLWARKLLIASLSAGMLAASFFYAKSLEPEFRSSAIFEVKTGGQGPSIPSEYAGLASLAGVAVGGGDGNSAVFERLTGRDFVIDLAHEIDLFSDPYFLPPEGSSKPILARLGLMSFEEPQLSQVEKEEELYAHFQKAVGTSETEHGFVEIQVSHSVPERAAVIANAMMERLIAEVSVEQEDEQVNQLSYLSDQLADSLGEMEAAQKAVADFALANSLVSSEEFASRSQLVFEQREVLRNAKEMSHAVGLLEDVLENNARPGNDDYVALREQAPVIDSVAFRRLIGLPEALDAWTWPSKSRLREFKSTLDDRAARVERSISELLVEAERYASSTEALAALRREAKVAEAAYNVLIEQVKTQALVSGYQGSVARIYQTAVPATSPVAPRVVTIIASGAMLGLFLGVFSALVLGGIGGRIYSKSALRDRARTQFHVTGMRGGRSSRVTARSLMGTASKVSGSDWSELAVAHQAQDRKVTLVMGTAAKMSTIPTAHWMAKRAQSNGHRAAILLLGESIPSGAKRIDEGSDVHLDRLDISGVDFLAAPKGSVGDDVLANSKVVDMLSASDPRYDRVFVACSAVYAPAAARAYRDLTPFVVLVTKPGRTQRSLLERLTSIAPPDANVIV